MVLSPGPSENSLGSMGGLWTETDSRSSVRYRSIVDSRELFGVVELRNFN